jgi:protein O-mannosyl-transferase
MMSSGSASTRDEGLRPLAPLDAQNRSDPHHLTNIDWFVLAAICLSTFALFARTGRFDFIGYDDATYITNDPHIRGGLSWQNLGWMMVDSAGGNWCPLTLFVQLALSTIFGVKPAAFHLTNVLLHAVTAGLLFVLLRQTTGRRWAAVAVSVLWAWHPLRVQSVAWCVEMKDVLCGALCVACLILYANYRRQPGIGRYFAVVAVFTLALSAKAMAVTLPAVMLLLDYWPLGAAQGKTSVAETVAEDATTQAAGVLNYWRRFAADDRMRTGPRLPRFLAQPWLHRAVEKLPLIGIAAAISLMTWVLQRNAGATGNLSIFPISLRLKNTPVAYFAYLAQTFWPAKLAVFYPHPGMIDQSIPVSHWFPAVGGLALITALTVVLGRKRPYLPVGWFWYIGMLLPVIGLIQVGEQSRADRYTYLPSIGLTIALVLTVDDLSRNLRGHLRRATAKLWVTAAGAVATTAIAAALAVVTFVELGYWRDNQTLFARANAVVPHNYLAESVLSAHMLLEDRVDEALALAAASVAGSPHSAFTHHAYGLALLKAGRPKEAVHELKDAVRDNYLDSGIRADLAQALLAEGRDDDALAQFKEAVRLNPDDSLAHHNLAAMYARQGHYEDAIAQWDVALRLSPNDGVVHGWLGEALRVHGDRAAAMQHLRVAFALGEHNPDWETDLAWYIATDPSSTVQQAEQTITIAQDAVARTGGKPIALDTLAAVLARAGRFNDAVATAQRAAERARANGAADLAKSIEPRIELYRAGQPYIVSTKTNSQR